MEYNKDLDNIDMTKVPFEVALNEAGFGLYSYFLTALTGLSIISYVCIIYASTIIVPASACELETTSSQQGLLVAVPLIGTIVGALIWGYLADTRGRRSMLMVSFLSAATVLIIASISVNWIMLLCLQFIAATLNAILLFSYLIFSWMLFKCAKYEEYLAHLNSIYEKMRASGQYSLPMTILSESVPMAKRNLVLILVTSIFLLSQGIMAILAIPIIPLSFSYYLSGLDIYWNSWRTVLVVYCVPSLISALWLLFMQESPKFVFSKGDEERALQILRTIHKMNHRGSKDELQVKGLLEEKSQKPKGKSSMKDQILPLFKAPLLKFTIIMTTLSVFKQVGAFLVWLPTIANQFVEIIGEGESSGLTLCDIIAASIDAPPDPDAVPCALDVTALLIVFCVAVLQSLVNALISLVVDRTGRRNTSMVIMGVCGISGILVNLVPNAIGSAVLFVVFLVGMLTVGLYTAMTVALFPTHLRALAVSVTMTGGRLASFASIQILNFLLIDNCEIAFYVFSSIVASSVIILSFLPDDRFLGKTQAPQARKEEEAVEEEPQYEVDRL